jgi:hypothetical protein
VVPVERQVLTIQVEAVVVVAHIQRLF